ncbi:MAG: hypothetical protein J6K01_08760 [Paludibacteraceae bacterium]|nr:hypothetical protein [Paludibacteraceae bacterium]
MKLLSFSERYGYTKPSDVIIREKITPEIQNAICSCFDRLPRTISINNIWEDCKLLIDKHLWSKFLNKREADIYEGNRYYEVFTPFIEDKNNKWFEKLNLVESAITFLYNTDKQNHTYPKGTSKNFIDDLNSEFERLNFAYHIIGTEIVEISSEEEIKTIETAMQESQNNIKTHLCKALELYAQRPEADYRNSIKESTSAVEACCRKLTGENSLGKALSKLEKNGVYIPQTLKNAFEKLYAYTNDGDSGIRHALMDETASYVPGSAEAYFMLVSCSAFINYLNRKTQWN